MHYSSLIRIECYFLQTQSLLSRYPFLIMDNRILNLLIAGLVLFVIDYYVLQAFIATKNNPKTRKRILYGYWIITGLTFLSVFMGVFMSIGRTLRTIIFVWFFINYFTKLFILPFLFIDDIRRGIIWLKGKGKREKEKGGNSTLIKANDAPIEGSGIPRSDFLVKTGLLVASIPFAALNIGMVSGVYDYKVKRKKLVLPNLPKAFEGMKLGQISDVHSGSFYNKRAVMGGIDLLNAEKPDMVFFTGDLVNDQTAEMHDYMDIFNKIKAPLGVYSVLGNHDYGDYIKWNSPQAKKQNLEDLKRVHKNLGWDLLMNENRKIKVGNEEIAVLGIENWGAMARFPKHGRMDLAVKGTEEAPVKLLLSHDPSHWRAEILPKYQDIDAMFAGHTHGMQFGVQFGDFQWSPVQYVYKEWAGFYKEKQQQLYVNVGYGFLGYPGRLGIYPEITIFELTRG